MPMITCPRCGSSFETAARTNTRCRSCKTVVRVPAGTQANGKPTQPKRSKAPAMLVLLLACDHLLGYLGEDVPARKANEYLWICDECGAEDQEVQQVLAALSEAELTGLDDDDWGELVATRAG
ncbi:MAG: hypothetical protein ACYDGN_16340 [Acidimicrobiales bacterium]